MTFAQNITYGIVVGLVVFFIGWITGMGGDFLPNVVFSFVMGVLAFFVVRIFIKISKK